MSKSGNPSESGNPSAEAESHPGMRRVQVERSRDDAAETRWDWVAVEEPLEIRIGGESLVVTLRTPGQDVELAVGFLFSEGILQNREDLVSAERCRDATAYDPDNVVDVVLSESAAARHQEIEHTRRDFMAAAACGLCGKARIEAIYQRLPEKRSAEDTGRIWQPADLRRFPIVMEERQSLFAKTGGLHAAALFDADGRLHHSAEDVGRHNAVDKLIGAAFLAGELPWHDHAVVVSARAGFEIVQKVMMAQASAMVAVGAASSLAVEAATRGGLELHSFVRADRSNRHLT